MGKQLFIDQLKETERISELFLVKSARLGETKAGKPYLSLTLMDRSGEIPGVIWDDAVRLAEFCRVGAVVRIDAQVQSYRDQLQLKIDGAQSCPPEHTEVADYVPACPGDREEMAAEIQSLVASISDPYLKKLLNRFFRKGEVWELFLQAPAAKGIHHAYLGGLLEHSLSVAGLADRIAGHYAGIDRSLLITGALLHDLGKIWELKMDLGVIDYSDRGRLKGHLVMGSEAVAQAAARIKGFPAQLLEQVQHLILSHHGRLEFGSPTLPMTPEAFVLSFVDDLDAKMNLMEQLRRKLIEPEAQWSDYQRSLERYLYLGPLPAEEEAGEPNKSAAPQADSPQKRLF